MTLMPIKLDTSKTMRRLSCGRTSGLGISNSRGKICIFGNFKLWPGPMILCFGELDALIQRILAGRFLKSHGAAIRCTRPSAVNDRGPRAAASPWSQTAAQAASKAGMPWASRPVTRPASTSPEPAVARRWRGVAVDRGAAIGAGDHGVSAFQDDDGAGAFRGHQGALMFRFRNICQIAEKAGKFAFMRGDDDGAVGAFGDGSKEFGGVLGEGGQGIGVKHGCGTAGQDGAHLRAGFGADAGGGADADGIAALVVEEHAKSQSIIGLRQHEGGGVGGVDEEFIFVARDGDEPCPDFQGGLGGKA